MRDGEEKKIRKAERDKGDERENSGICLLVASCARLTLKSQVTSPALIHPC